MMYKPYVIFAWITAVFGVLGTDPLRAVRRAVGARPRRTATSSPCCVGAVLLILAFMSLMLGVISDLIRTNRVLIEDSLEHTKRNRFRVPYPGVDHPPPTAVLALDRTADTLSGGGGASVAATSAAAARARDPDRRRLRLPARPRERRPGCCRPSAEPRPTGPLRDDGDRRNRLHGAHVAGSAARVRREGRPP